jgi:hypothetical protein
MGGMDDPEHLPAVVVPRPVLPARPVRYQPARWEQLSKLPDRIRRASRHPAVAGSLATAAGLALHAGLRWALAAQGRSAQPMESAVTPLPSPMTGDPGLVLFRRTVVIDTWIVRGRQT